MLDTNVQHRRSNNSTSVSKSHSSWEERDVAASAWDAKTFMIADSQEPKRLNRNAGRHLWYRNTALQSTVLMKAQDSVEAHAIDEDLP